MSENETRPWPLTIEDLSRDRPKKVILVDQRCYDLAKYWLADEEDQSDDRIMALAEAIQTTVEDFLA